MSSADEITLGGVRAGGATIESFPSSPIATLIAERDEALAMAQLATVDVARLTNGIARACDLLENLIRDEGICDPEDGEDDHIRGELARLRLLVGGDLVTPATPACTHRVVVGEFHNQWRPFEIDRDACTLAGIYASGVP